MKDELGRKIMTKFVGLRAKTYTYLIDHSSEDKKANGTKKCLIKWKRKFENYKNCLKAAQFENKINYLEKNRTDINSIKEFIENNQTMLKIQQIFNNKKRKMLIVLDDMIVDELSNKKLIQ